MSSLRRSFQRHRQRQQRHTTPPTSPVALQPVPAPLARAAAVFDYEGDRVVIACTRCHNSEENGALEDIIQLSHGPLPIELPNEWFTRQDGTLLVAIPDGQPVMGYCHTCEARTPMRIYTEQEGHAAAYAGIINLFGQDWTDEDD